MTEFATGSFLENFFPPDLFDGKERKEDAEEEEEAEIDGLSGMFICEKERAVTRKQNECLRIVEQEHMKL